MINKLKRFINILENSQISFQGFMITLFCIIFLRNFLEAFSDIDNFLTPVSSIANFIHYPMFYICLLLALTIILFCLTREKIIRITKVILFFFPLVLLAPILDLLLSGGKGYNMSYLFGDLPVLFHKFITLSWSYTGRGMTPGIQIELIIVFFLVGCYLFLKTGKVISIIVGFIVLYIVLFTLGSMPSIITFIWNLIGSIKGTEELFSAEIVLNHFYSFNHKIILVFFPILLVELGLWYWYYDKQKFLAILKNIRGLRVFHYICMLVIGMFLGYKFMHPENLWDSPFPALILFTSVFSVALAWWWAVGINDFHDLEGDRISNLSRPLVTRTLQLEEYRKVNVIFFLLSLVGAIVIRYQFLVTILITIGLSYIYSAPPFRLKRVPFLATLIIALCSATVCLAGYILFSNNYSFHGFPPRILFTILVAFTLAFNVIDIKDLQGDRTTGTITLPTLLGEKKGKRVIGVLVLLSYLCVPLILKCFILMPFAIFFGILTYFLINRKQIQETLIFVLYFLFLGVTLYFIYPQIYGNLISHY